MDKSAFKAFIDYEVDVSGSESADEITEENRDLSGFITSGPNTPHNNSVSFYRQQSMLPTNQGYKFQAGYQIGQQTKKSIYSDEGELPSSLKSFVVDDEEVQFETQRYDPLDFDDEDKNHTANTTTDLEDLLEFE